MKAAIYARKSTDDNDRTTDNKSVNRQIDHARAYADNKGWIVCEEHIYVDDGVSGAEFKNRPALLQLLNDLKEFDVIIMSELSRLGREQSQTANVLANIYAKERRVFLYLTDEEVRFDTAIDKFMISAVTFGAELEREKASQRSRDALERKARRGYNTGGVVFGYDNIPVVVKNGSGEETRSHTDYQINPEQAEVIRSIFRMRADGMGLTSIAKTLNGDPTFSQLSTQYLKGARPSSPRKGTGSWAPSSVRSILYNDRYLGRVPFGLHRKVYRAGTKARIKTTERETADRPELRIVDQSLWEAVQQLNDAAKKEYIRSTNGMVWGRPGMGMESKYLLTGLGRCGCCGSNLTVLGGTPGGAEKRSSRYYGCSYRHHRGSTVCANDHRVRMIELDEAVLKSIEEQVLIPSVVTAAIERAFEMVMERQQQNPGREKEIGREIRRLHRELDNLIKLVAGGNAPDRVLTEIASREARIKALEGESATLAMAEPTELDIRRLKRVLERHASGFRDLVRADVPRARTALRSLLDGPIRFNPVVTGGRKSYAFEGETRIGVLVDPGYTGVASPRGFEPLLPP